MQFQKEVNSQANIREYLITFTNDSAITTADSIKLQASSLAQLTQATNQLTRTTLVRFISIVVIAYSVLYFVRSLHRNDVINYRLLYNQCQEKFLRKMFKQQQRILFNVLRMF